MRVSIFENNSQFFNELIIFLKPTRRDTHAHTHSHTRTHTHAHRNEAKRGARGQRQQRTEAHEASEMAIFPFSRRDQRCV